MCVQFIARAWAVCRAGVHTEIHTRLFVGCVRCVSAPALYSRLAASRAREKEYANKKRAAYVFPGRNLSLTVDEDPKAEISSKE